MPEEIRYVTDTAHDTMKPVLYIQKQLVKFPGQHIRIFNKHMRLMAKAHALPLRLREKIEIYSDEEKANHIATSSTKKVFDLNAVFTITEPEDGKVMGSLRRKGLSSELLRDTWHVYDAKDNHIATLVEPSVRYSLVRRWLFGFLRQTYALRLTDNSNEIVIKQIWNPLFLRYKVYAKNFSGFEKKIPQTLLISLLCTIVVIEDGE